MGFPLIPILIGAVSAVAGAAAGAGVTYYVTNKKKNAQKQLTHDPGDSAGQDQSDSSSSEKIVPGVVIDSNDAQAAAASPAPEQAESATVDKIQKKGKGKGRKKK